MREVVDRWRPMSAVSTMLLLIVAAPARGASPADAPEPYAADIAICNAQARESSGTPSASPPTPRQPHGNPPSLTPAPGVRTGPSGTIIVDAPDPLVKGMAAAGWDDPAYRSVYRECMKSRLERRR